MSIKIGDVDIANEIIDLKFQLLRTQMIIEALVQGEPKSKEILSKKIKTINEKALESIRKAYPNMGIEIEK